MGYMTFYNFVMEVGKKETVNKGPNVAVSQSSL